MKLKKFVIFDHLFVILCHFNSFDSLPILCTCYLAEDCYRWLVYSIDNSLALLDLDEVSKFPCKLTGDIVIICHIVDIYEIIFQDCLKDKFVVNLCISTHVEVIVGTMPEIQSGFILGSVCFGFIELAIVNELGEAISSFNVDLFAVGEQVHVLDLASSTKKVDVVFLEHCLV